MTRSKLVVVTAVFSVALISLFAGVMWQRYSASLGVSIHQVNELREYENHWRPLNVTEPVAVDDWKDKAVVVNFWGSWCPPCIEEMPLLDKFNTEHGEQGVQVVGVVIDQEEAAKAFLESNQIRFPSVIADMQVTNELMESLGNKDGVLPFTVAFSKSGEREFMRQGPVTEEDLQTLIQ